MSLKPLNFKGFIQKTLKNHVLFILFTIIYFAFAFLTYKDFGVTYDERVEYDNGKFLLSYLQNPTPVFYVDELVNSRPVHIEARQLPLYSVYSRVYPALLNILNPNYYFEWFHLQNMCMGFFLFLFSYILFYLNYRSGIKAIVAPLFLSLTSLLLGHIPANPKDIPFATSYLLGVLAIHIFQKYKASKYLKILVLGTVFGLAQSQRTVALTLFVLQVFLEVFSKENLDLKTFLDCVLENILIFIVSLLVWIICLPFLGASFFANFKEILHNAAGYPEWDHEIIYFGKFLYKDQRPWHYLYVYMLIKLPVVTLFSFIGGTLACIFKKIKYKLNHPVTFLMFLVVVNSILYLVLHPVIYNGIRHFLYLVTCVTLISAFFFVDILAVVEKKYKVSILAVVFFYGVFTVGRMFHLHPYEYIYYNELIGGLKGAEGKFDMEYWGAGYKKGAEYVRELIEDMNLKDIKVYPCDNQFAVVYYSRFEYEIVNRSRDAELMICDTHKDTLRGYYDKTHPIIVPVKREGVTIFNIRARKDFIEENL